jgi:phenylalanyl-tRNA synthetase beta chain
MPTVNILFNDLQRLVGVPLPRDAARLDDVLSNVKGEVVSLLGTDLTIEIKDGNRPDLWSVEGIARALRGYLGVEEGLKPYAVRGYSGVEVHVDPRLQGVRPYIACAVVEDVRLTGESIRALMHLQDKLDLTYGRKRRRTSIGVYDHDLITPPIAYEAVLPDAVQFRPLGGDATLSLNEIVATHPKGLEYGPLISEHARWPLLRDANGNVLSLPPIINSDDLGRITESVSRVFIEVTGMEYPTVLNALTTVTLSLADRGNAIYSTRILYPYGETRVDETPTLTTRTMPVERAYVDTVLGLELDNATILQLLKKGRYDARAANGTIHVSIPCYRLDVLHPIDVVEDIAIMYGYNRIPAKWPEAQTFGGISQREHRTNVTREIMIGLGFQEILSLSMSTKANLQARMNLPEDAVLEVLNPMTSRHTCVRNWLLPNLLEFLSGNTHHSYPQRIFEVGDCVAFDEIRETGVREVRKLACLVIHPRAEYSEARGVLDALLGNIGGSFEVRAGAHGSFLEGRVARLLRDGEAIGCVGELDPHVIEAWNLENPVAGFEVDVDGLFAGEN